MAYAIISLGGKQYRVQEGERLLVDRLPHGEGKTFHPDVLLLGVDGKTELAPKGVQVTAKVLGHPLGEKLRIGKYRPKTGYRKHTGFRARLSQVEITSIGKKTQTRAKAAEEKPQAATTKKAQPRTRSAAAKKTTEKK
jgi:large subunit ribosomal protein L21